MDQFTHGAGRTEQHMNPDGVWSDYLSWNDALCKVAFSQAHSGLPVYLDMDDEVLDRAGKHLGLAAGEAAPALAAAVRATLTLNSEVAVFRHQLFRLRLWRS